MTITDVKTYLVRPDYRNLIFVKVITDDGIEGIGEAYSCGPDEATVKVIEDFARWLIGRDPMDREGLWALMYQGTRFPGGNVTNAALSGIDQALWDVAGKALGVPCYQLLGGKCRDKIRVYQSTGSGADAKAKVEKYGYTGLKMGPHPPGSEKMPWNAVVRGAAERLRDIREAVGPDVDIGVDPHAKIFEPVRALQMAEALAPFQPMFFEEPLRPENIDALAEFKRRCPIPVATGEMLYTKFEFRDLLVRGAADIIQPDICLCGGVLEFKKIASMAEAFYVTVAPHNPMGPVATAVNVHVCATIPNFLILEYVPDDAPPRRELLKEPLRVENGYIAVPDKPGWGIELNEEAFAKYPPAPWHRSFPWREDGSLGFI